MVIYNKIYEEIPIFCPIFCAKIPIFLGPSEFLFSYFFGPFLLLDALYLLNSSNKTLEKNTGKLEHWKSRGEFVNPKNVGTMIGLKGLNLLVLEKNYRNNLIV